MNGFSRATVSALLSTVVLAAPVGAQAAQTATAHVHLAGIFELAGTVTVADDLPGEHVGEHVLRKWQFLAPCPTGSCRTTTLVRSRAHGRDRVKLRRRAPGYYVGTGSFFAPLRCDTETGSHTYPRGALVPFTITVRITGEKTELNGTLLATNLRATYVNSRRTNRTPCVSVLGHDAAKYHGHVVAV